MNASFLIAQGLFLKALGIVYFIAFTSLAIQVLGLYGSKGIQPIATVMQQLRRSHSRSLGIRVPTLFWFNTSDRFLRGVAFAGIGLSLLVIVGVAPAIFLALLWIFYFSFYQVGYPFLNFQWDALLLETGFVAFLFSLLAPVPPLLLAWLWILLFRFMFSSGYTKLRFGSSEWRDLTAMDYHFETQPLPTQLGYYAHQQPRWLSKLSVLGVYFVELITPFFIFGPVWLRLIGFWILIGFQVMIFATGNYAFFNLLTIALCIPLLPDPVLSFFQPISTFNSFGAASHPYLWTILSVIAGVFLIANALDLATLFFSSHWIEKILRPFRRYCLMNSYGLFVHMTTIRNEIIVEGSDEQQNWLPYSFKWKPQDLSTPPGLVAPHQPRLDWQMWFAALSSHRHSDWFTQFLFRLLEGSPDVLRLLKHNPFPNRPPRYIRSVIYGYQFTSLEEKRKTGAWWKRSYLGLYSPIYSVYTQETKGH